MENGGEKFRKSASYSRIEGSAELYVITNTTAEKDEKEEKEKDKNGYNNKIIPTNNNNNINPTTKVQNIIIHKETNGDLGKGDNKVCELHLH